MLKIQPYIYVLWAKECDSIAVTTFVTELRKAGLLVKIVGVDGRKITGMHGLTLMPDWTLEQALAQVEQVISIVIPCRLTQFRQLYDDPRLLTLIHSIYINGAKFIVSQADAPLLPHNMPRLPPVDPSSPVAKIIAYPADEHLAEFARRLSRVLVGNRQSQCQLSIEAEL